MTDITKLAQRTDLLMGNALETAKQLRELSESTVADAIFESIVENENGKEIQFERPISDLAYAAFLQLERLVEALEKAQTINAAAEKLVRCKGRYHSELNYRALATLFGVTTPDLPPLDGEPVGEVIEVGDALLVEWHKNLEEGAKLYTAPQAPVMPFGLHPDTQKLVTDFCAALAEKLYKAQLKYGYDADWKQDGWQSQCQAHFHQHIAKGDPRDVAAYCAFMWWHDWSTKPAEGLESRTVTVKLPEPPGPMSVGARTVYFGIVADVVSAFQYGLTAAGIKLEAE